MRLAAAPFVIAIAITLSGCATRFEPAADGAGPRLRMQSASLAPGRGGELIDASSLAVGDILLSAAPTLQSAAIQLATLAPVSHALLYLGDVASLTTGRSLRYVGHLKYTPPPAAPADAT